MNVTHEVGAVWRIVDQGTPTLRLIGEALSKIDAIAKSVEERLGRIGVFKLTGLIEEFGKVGGAAEAAKLKIQDLSETRFAGINRGLTGVSSRLERIERQAGAAGRALGSMPALPAPGGGGGGGHPRGPQGGARNRLGHRGGRHGAGIDTGIFGFIGAEAVGHGVGDIIKHGAELQHVQEQMLQGGMKSSEVAEATAKAWEQASRYGLNVVKVMEDIKELRFPFGSTEHAVEFIDPLERMRVVLNSVSEGKGNESADAVYKMARAGELKGLVEPKDYLSYFDEMTKVISATGGKVGPNDFMQFAKFGKLSTFGFDEEFFTRYAPTMIQTMGASTAGQSMMSLFNTLESGAVTKRSLGQMSELGLVGDASKIKYDKQGNPVGFAPGAIKGSDELARNPFAWAKDVLTPLLEQKYGDLSDPKNKEQAIQALGGLFGNRNSAAAVAELALRSKSFDRDSGIIGTASGIGGANRLLSQDPNAAFAKIQASWSNFLISLGLPAVQKAIDSLNLLSSGVNKLSEFANAHPDVMRNVVGALTGLAAGFGALALVGLAIFLPQGAFVVAMTTLGGALVGIAAMNWSAIEEDFRALARMLGFLRPNNNGFLRRPHHGRSGSDPSAMPGAMPGLGGGYGGSWASPMAYTNDNDNPLTQAVRQGFVLAFQDIQGGNFGAAGGSGGGFTNASFTTYGSGGGAGFGGLSGGPNGFFPAGAPGSAVDTALGLRGLGSGGAAAALGANMTNGQWCADFVNGALAKHGIKGTGSSAALSFSRWGSAVGAGAAQRGDIAFENHGGGHGHVMMLTGEHDARGWLGVVAGNSGGVVKRYWENPAKLSGIRRAIPSIGAPPAASRDETHTHHIHLDGKIVASAVTRRQTARARFATSVGQGDAHGSFMGPSTPFTDAA